MTDKFEFKNNQPHQNTQTLEYSANANPYPNINAEHRKKASLL